MKKPAPGDQSDQNKENELERLSDREARLQMSLDAARIGIFQWESTGHKVVLSPMSRQVFGLVAGNEFPTSDEGFNVVHPEDRARHQSLFEEAARLGSDYHSEYRIIRPYDGKVAWVEERGKASRDPVTGAMRFHGVHWDITERKEAEKALADQRRLYEGVLSTTPDFAYIFDLDHRFIYANEGLLKMWGKSWKEAIGKNCLELGYADWHAAMHDREIERVIATRQPIRGEVPFSGTFGRRIYDYIFTPVMGDEGQVIAVAGTTRDITEQKNQQEELARSLAREKVAREEAESAARMKDNFLAAMSHELRTPLNPVILIASEEATNPELPDTTREQFATILENAEVQARLIDDLLDLSLITHGKVKLKLEATDMHELLKAAMEKVREQIKEKKIHLKIRLDATQSVIHADAVRLQQVSWNLLKNAIKFTPSGGSVEVKTSSTPKRLSLEVKDSGIGMTAAEIGDAFAAFSQGDHAKNKTSVYGGLGLGLAISKKLVDLHGGEIRAESKGRNQGATLIVEFPISPV